MLLHFDIERDYLSVCTTIILLKGLDKLFIIHPKQKQANLQVFNQSLSSKPKQSNASIQFSLCLIEAPSFSLEKQTRRRCHSLYLHFYEQYSSADDPTSRSRKCMSSSKDTFPGLHIHDPYLSTSSPKYSSTGTWRTICTSSWDFWQSAYRRRTCW